MKGLKLTTSCIIFGTFFAFYNHNHVMYASQSYDVCFLRYGVQQKELFVILGHYLGFYPPYNPENQNFEKMKKKPLEILSFYTCAVHEQKNKKTTNQIKFSMATIRQQIKLVLQHSLCK